MNLERDKFLTEAMGECWHDNEYGMHYTEWSGKYPDYVAKCNKCGEFSGRNRNFSTWDGFGKLLEWCKQQEMKWLRGNNMMISFLTPDRFADAVYNYLKEKK